MERDEAYNARDLAYHMTEEDYEDMMHGEIEWEDDDGEWAIDAQADFDEGDFARFQDDFDDDDYMDDDVYCDWHDDHPEFDE